METILAELRSGGVHDSTGRFSLDLRHGLEKLRKYQLLDKNRYGLLLMAAANRRGAREVHIKNDADELILSWPGEPLTRAELEDLFRLDGPLLPLGLALLSAQALKPFFIRIDSGPWRLELKSGAMRVAAIPDFEGVRVQVRERYSWRAFAKYALEWLQLPPESALVARHCAGLGLPITINGKPLQHLLDVGPCWLVLKLVGKTDTRVLDAVRTANTTLMVERSHEGDFSAVAIVGSDLERRGLTVVAQGLRFPQPDILSPDLFLAILLVRPEQRVDLSYARVHADEPLMQALAVVQQTVDEALVESLDSAPFSLHAPIAARFLRRGQRALWLTVQARQLVRVAPSGRTIFLREIARHMPEQATAPVWQEALRRAFEGVVAQRRGNIHAQSELRALGIDLALMQSLRPEPALLRDLQLEQGFLQAALGALPEAEAFLQAVPDHRLGLVTLLRYRDPRWLPSTPLANGLTALLQDRMGEARAALAQAPRLPVVLDLRARLEALGGDWDEAARLNRQAIASSRGLMLRQRQAFGGALASRRLDHPMIPPGDLTEQLEADRAERGVALWSRADAGVMAHLYQAVGDTQAPRTAAVQLGAVQPYARVVAWTVANRRLSMGLNAEAFELILLFELTALWGPEGFWT